MSQQGFKWSPVQAAQIDTSLFSEMGKARNAAIAGMLAPVGNFIDTVRANNTQQAIAAVNGTNTLNGINNILENPAFTQATERAGGSSAIDLDAVQKALTARPQQIAGNDQIYAENHNASATRNILYKMSQNKDIQQDVAKLDMRGVSPDMQKLIAGYGVEQEKLSQGNYKNISDRIAVGGAVYEGMNRKDDFGEKMLPEPNEFLDPQKTIPNQDWAKDKQAYDAQQARYQTWVTSRGGNSVSPVSVINAALGIGGGDIGVLANNVQASEGRGYNQGTRDFTKLTTVNGAAFTNEQKQNMNIMSGLIDKTKFSDTAKREMYAHLGREGGFETRNLSGTHNDANANRSNTGIISYSYPSRRNSFLASMGSQGFLEADGKTLKHSPQALEAQMRFVENEMATAYPKQYAIVTDPNSTPEQVRAAFNSFIGWDTKLQSGHDNLSLYGTAWDMVSGSGTQDNRQVFKNAAPQMQSPTYSAPAATAAVTARAATASPTPAVTAPKTAPVTATIAVPKPKSFAQGAIKDGIDKVPQTTDLNQLVKYVITGDVNKGEINRYLPSVAQAQSLVTQATDSMLKINADTEKFIADSYLDSEAAFAKGDKLTIDQQVRGGTTFGRAWGNDAGNVQIYNAINKMPEYQRVLNGDYSDGYTLAEMSNAFSKLLAQEGNMWWVNRKDSELQGMLRTEMKRVSNTRLASAEAFRKAQITQTAQTLAKNFGMNIDNVTGMLSRVSAVQRSRK